MMNRILNVIEVVLDFIFPLSKCVLLSTCWPLAAPESEHREEPIDDESGLLDELRELERVDREVLQSCLDREASSYE